MRNALLDLQTDTLHRIVTLAQGNKPKAQAAWEEVCRFLAAPEEEAELTSHVVSWADRANQIIDEALKAPTKPEDLAAMTEAYRPLGPDRVAFTKLDETKTVGSVVEFLDSAPLPLSYLSDGQRVPEDLSPAEPALMVDRILR